MIKRFLKREGFSELAQVLQVVLGLTLQPCDDSPQGSIFLFNLSIFKLILDPNLLILYPNGNLFILNPNGQFLLILNPNGNLFIFNPKTEM